MVSSLLAQNQDLSDQLKGHGDQLKGHDQRLQTAESNISILQSGGGVIRSGRPLSSDTSISEEFQRVRKEMK